LIITIILYSIKNNTINITKQSEYIKMIDRKLKELRSEKKLSLAELERKSGVSYVQIRRYESGKTKPTIRVLNKLATAMEVDVNYFLKEETMGLEINKLEGQFMELKVLLENDEENKLALSKIFEAMIFKENIKKSI